LILLLGWTSTGGILSAAGVSFLIEPLNPMIWNCDSALYRGTVKTGLERHLLGLGFVDPSMFGVEEIK
jgi:hypothetical protein